MLYSLACGEASILGRYMSSSCPPPSWLTNTLDARPVPLKSSFMIEHNLCTDSTDSSGASPIRSRVLHSDRVMSSPAVVNSSEAEGTQIPSSCLVDADEAMPAPILISRCSALAPGKAVQSNTSSTSPGTCMTGSRTSSQKKLLASDPAPLSLSAYLQPSHPQQQTQHSPRKSHPPLSLQTPKPMVIHHQ